MTDMLNKNPHIFILLFVISFFGLIACSSQTSPSDYSLVVPDAGDPYSINEQGVLVVNGDIVWFHDFETGEKVIVCNQPDCSHEPYDRRMNPDPICLATKPAEGYISAVGIYDNDIYMFVVESNAETMVYQIDLINSSRKELATLDWEISTLNNFKFNDGRAYFHVYRFILEEGSLVSSGLEHTFLSLDLKTGETAQFGQVKDDNYASISNFKKLKIKFTIHIIMKPLKMILILCLKIMIAVDMRATIFMKSISIQIGKGLCLI